MNQIMPVAAPRRLLTPLLGLGILVLVGYCTLALQPGLRHRLGLGTERMWFLDSYAVLASSDAVQAGLDPAQPNPLDVFNRPHSYSGWWFLLGRFGFTREDNFLIGGSWVLLFFVTAYAWLRPQQGREAVWAALLILSPPVQLAVLRANNDLVVFALLGLALLAVRPAGGWRIALLGLAVVLATGLKFYPLAAAAGLMTIGSPRLRWWSFAATMTAGGLVLASQWSYFQKAVFPVPTAVYTFGASVWWRELGFTGRGVTVVSTVLLLVGAGLCRGQVWSTGLASEETPLKERMAFTVGATLLVVCWLLGISFAYRWIFALLLVPWLWRRVGERSARVALGLMLACMWADAVFCLATNIFIGPMPEAKLQRIQHAWLLSTQPFTWVLLALLAGWLLDLGLARLAEWRAPRPVRA